MNKDNIIGNKRSPWNKVKLVGQEPPLKLHEIWSICIRLEPIRLRNALNEKNKSYTDMQATKNLRAIQLLLGHTRLESTVRYLGIEVDDVLELVEQTEA